MDDANDPRARACALVRALGLAIAGVALVSACGAGMPAPASAAPSGGRGAPGGGASGGDDPATTPADPDSRAQRAQKADDCLSQCYRSPAAISGDALRDMCEKKCGSSGSGKAQPTPK